MPQAPAPAIATLSGAAATTATLYWIGSSIGMGVVAGILMLTGGALAAGVPAPIAVRRRILGRHRTEQDLDAREQAALYAALRLAAPVLVARARETPLSRVEMRLFARQGLGPLTAALDELYTTDLGNDRGATVNQRARRDTAPRPTGPKRRKSPPIGRYHGATNKLALLSQGVLSSCGPTSGPVAW